MKDLEVRLNRICSRIGQLKQDAVELLKDYIRQNGEIDWSDEECKIETTFYGDGYYTAEVNRVLVDENNDELVIVTDLGVVGEYDGDFSSDTILDILCSVIGNASVVE